MPQVQNTDTTRDPNTNTKKANNDKNTDSTSLPQVLLLLHPTKLFDCQSPTSLHPSAARLQEKNCQIQIQKKYNYKYSVACLRKTVKFEMMTLIERGYIILWVTQCVPEKNRFEICNHNIALAAVWAY